MLIDLRQLAGDESFEADACVVGAGAAGITIARELGAAGHSVLLAESGGLDFDLTMQGLYSGVESGSILSSKTQYLSSSRLRYFGGTMGHWNGYCRPLDSEDFELRPWVADVAWPISLHDLDPYYERASPLLEISPFDYEQESAGKGAKLLAEDDAFETNFFHLSPPSRFGELYRPELAASETIKVLLYANLRRLALDPAGRRVESCEIVRLDGRTFPVRARHVVLATGGIENARLLLANRDVQPEGLGNDFDQVGRYFMDHPTVKMGCVALPYWRRLMAQLYAKSYVAARRNSIRGVLRVRSDFSAREQLLNGIVRFEPLTAAEKRELSDDIARFATAQHLLAGQQPPAAASTYHGWVIIHGEQSPNPASRVTLTEETDALGMPRTHLDWQLSPRDAESLARTAELLAHRLGARNLGRLRNEFTAEDAWSEGEWSWHHIGTTRMHEDPKRGVVDADCRLHSLDNLFVAGSSVFPTSGISNPTYTIVALALRLSDHLKSRLAA
jgi:choline dehydrogenase-like flavoprotein